MSSREAPARDGSVLGGKRRSDLRGQSGIGLTILVILIAVSGIIIYSSTSVAHNMMRQTQLRIDQTKAHYLAQAGVMRAVWKWYTNNDVAVTNEINRAWSPINTTVTGNNLFKSGSDSAGAYLQSNFAYIVPGISYVKNVLVASNTTSNSIMTVTIPAGTTIPVGNFLVIYFAMDGGRTAWVGGVGPSGVIDSVGNAYTRAGEIVGPANNNTGVRTVIWYSPITVALANPNTITIDWVTNTAVEAVTISEFSGIDTLDVVGTATGTLPGNPITTGNVATNFANEMIAGAIGIEGPAADVFTAGTDFIVTPPTERGAGAAAAGITIDPEYRVVSTAGNYAADGGNSDATRDWAAVIATFYAANRWVTSGADRRLAYWQVYNTHNASDITLTHVKVSWTGGGAARVNGFALNGVSKWPGGTAATGDTIDITDTALTPNTAWQGPNTYIQWDNAGPADPTTITCQFIFSGDTATSDAKTHEVVMWNGLRANGAGMPMDRVFTVTATGQVNQTTGKNFKVLKTVKAKVSGAPATAAAPAVAVMEITDWDEGDKNIP